MTLFQNKYRIETARLKSHDYGSVSSYFITICALNKVRYFGTIKNGSMALSESGQIANQFWLEIPANFDNTVMDEYIIMPDHMHGIIHIENTGLPEVKYSREEKSGGITGRFNIMNSVNALGKIIRWYKGKCSHDIRKNLSIDFYWLSRYYDHIIHTHTELERIRNYIRNNPGNWKY